MSIQIECAISKKLVEIAQIGGEPDTSANLNLQNPIPCSVEGCNGQATCEFGTFGTFTIRLQDNTGADISGHCRNEFHSQSIHIT